MKTINIQYLLLRLRKAYVAACKGLKLANKLKSKSHKSRIMGRMNKIRAELRKYELMAINRPETGFILGYNYTGVIFNVIKSVKLT